MDARLLPCGEQAILVELRDLDAVLALNHLVTALISQRTAAEIAPGTVHGFAHGIVHGEDPWDHVLDVIPAARTLLVTTADPSQLDALRAALLALLRAQGFRDAIACFGVRDQGSAVVEIGVHYDGPDVGEVATITGLTESEVIDAHTRRPWRVAFGGFAPGFAYLADGDPRLIVPRRHEPRTVVPAGAVGLAGRFSGIYPRPSPGGWQLLGHTDAALWDSDRTPPALLQPGILVRFVDADV